MIYFIVEIVENLNNFKLNKTEEVSLEHSL